MRPNTTLLSLMVAVALALAACGGDGSTESAETDPATVDSLPFASGSDDDTDGLLEETGDSSDEGEPSDEELFLDDQEPAPDVTPDEPLTATAAAALLGAATEADGDTAGETGDEASNEDDAVVVGTTTTDDTHIGMFGVTAEHLMRELTLAYGGQGEMLGEPNRTDAGGSFSFSLTAVTLDGSDSHRVDVTFSYVNDPDEPAMIIGHRADSVSLTPFELAG